MGSTFEDALQDFNLDLLSPSPSVVNQRQSILKLKSKVCAISYAINKYHETKEQFAQREVLLLAAKEECKQVCIDYKESLEKCSRLDKDIKSFQERNKELERNWELTQNQLKGLESHAKQLQLLANKHETIIGKLKRENQLEKNNAKDYEKKVLTLQKENETLLKNLCLARDIALGKKKLRKHHKVLLQKYNNDYTNGEHSSSESSSDDMDLFDSSPPSPINTFGAVSNKSEEVGIKIDKGEICVLKRDTIKNSEDHDSDCSNEIVSEDTGRGSSLAYSDGDKCFNSPDYFIHDSPFVSECNKIREKRVLFDACTSPIIVNELVHVATSPLMFDDEALLSDNNTLKPIEKNTNNTEYFITDIPLSTEIVTIKEKKTLVDVGTSTHEDIVNINVSTSPVAFKEPYIDKKQCMDSATSPIPIMENYNTNMIICTEDNTDDISNDIKVNETLEDELPSPEKRHKTIKNLSSQCEIEICSKSVEEIECLERNNSKNLCDETSNDCEIEMILNTMRLTDRLITPIPSTPIIIKKKHRKNEPTHHLTEVPEEHSVCAEATKLREEHQDLLKEVLKIKSILKKQKLMPESPTKQNESSDTINTKVYNDSDEDMLTIELEIEHDNSQNPQHETFDSCENIMSPHSPTLENTEFEDVKQVSLFGGEVNEEIRFPSVLKFKKTIDNSIEESTVENANNHSRNTFDIIRRLESSLEENSTGLNEIEELPICESNNTEVEIYDNINKKIKSKKLSRLDKFRKKFLPKNKIKNITVPIKRTLPKHKLKPVSNCKNKADELLKNQLAYEKARKVMAEINLKKGNEENKESRKADEQMPEIKAAQLNESNNNNIQIITRRKSREMLLSPRRNSSDINQPNIELNLKKVNKEYRKVEQRVPEIPEALLNESDNNSQIITRRKSREMLMSPGRNSGSGIKQPIICLDKIKINDFMTTEKEQNNQFSPKKSKVIALRNDDLSKRKIYTRNRSRCYNRPDPTTQIKFDSKNIDVSSSDVTEDTSIKSRMRLKRLASDNSPTDCKRILRSYHVRQMVIDHEAESDADTMVNTISDQQNCIAEDNENFTKLDDEKNKSTKLEFTCPRQDTDKIRNDVNSTTTSHPKDSILCKMLDKYGKSKTKFTAKKIPEDTVNLISKKLEESIEKINEMPVGDKSKSAMLKLVEEIQHSWNQKNFMLGLMHYLKDPARKQELFTKITSPPAPPMTKSEQVLLFVMKQLETSSSNTVSDVLTQIEFSLFQLNRTPEFDVIESLSHFYALLCRYFGFKNRLRLFILDAMYCLQFKVVPLIKQCLDVWMHILPLAHMGIAKSPLVTCLVYLLHFYKCEDKFNRVQEIRFILHKKYFYKITDWNEPKILEMFRNSIKELREIKVEKRMLRMAFIIIAKRQGPKWCQKNIIKNMLLPMVEKDDVPLRIKQFCVELLGPLLKPYPMDMKVHCEIVVNQLLDMLDTTTSNSMKEAILSSLIYMNKHNQSRVTKALLSWMPKSVSPEFEELMRDFVHEKPLTTWKRILSKTPV